MNKSHQSIKSFISLSLLFLFSCPAPYKVEQLKAAVVTEDFIVEKGLQSSMKLESLVYVMNDKVPEGFDLVAFEGTCFPINSKGDIISSFHITENALAIQADIYGFNEVVGIKMYLYSIPLAVKAVYADSDIVILRPSNPEDVIRLPKPLQIASDWNPVGRMPVWSFGFRTGWLKVNLTNPYLITVDISGRKYNPFLVAFPVAQQGDSGGPVLNEKAEVVGIIAAVNYDSYITLISPINVAMFKDLPE